MCNDEVVKPVVRHSCFPVIRPKVKVRCVFEIPASVCKLTASSFYWCNNMDQYGVSAESTGRGNIFDLQIHSTCSFIIKAPAVSGTSSRNTYYLLTILRKHFQKTNWSKMLKSYIISLIAIPLTCKHSDVMSESVLSCIIHSRLKKQNCYIQACRFWHKVGLRNPVETQAK